MHVAVTTKSIENASAQFWEQMLAMRLEPIPPDMHGGVAEPNGAAPHAAPHCPSVRCIGTGHVVGTCSLSGTWTGRIEVRLAHGLALEATSAMLMQPIASVQTGDTLDATREIANMIAGTIKSALPRPCSMTVPSAQVEPADFCILPRTEDSVTVFFHHASGELMVRVWEEMTVPPSDSANSSVPRL